MLDDKHDDLAIDNQIEEGHHFKGANKEFYEDLLRHQKILNELINNRPKLKYQRAHHGYMNTTTGSVNANELEIDSARSHRGGKSFSGLQT
jgi:hypothetical protein